FCVERDIGSNWSGKNKCRSKADIGVPPGKHETGSGGCGRQGRSAVVGYALAGYCTAAVAGKTDGIVAGYPGGIQRNIAGADGEAGRPGVVHAAAVGCAVPADK